MINIIFLLVQFMSLLAFGIFWYKILSWSPEESLCMAILCVISIAFVGSFWGQGLIALGIVYILSFVGICLFFFGKKLKVTADGQKSLVFFSPGVVFFSIIFLYGVIAFNGLVIFNWDEMSQWGKAVNYMLHNNTLPLGDGYDGESLLLSTTTLFHYYFCKMPKIMTGQIVESNMYVSNLVLWFAAAILPLSDMKWGEWKRCFVYGCIVFLSMHVLFVQPYFNIYCDQPVTIWAGAIIAWNFFCRKKKYREVFIILALMDISLMKNMMGPLFTVIIVLSMFIKYVMDFETGFKNTILAMKESLSVIRIIYAGLCICSVFLLTVIWSMRISKNALVRGDGVIKTGDERLELTIRSGLSKWFQPVNLSTAFPNMTFFLFLLLTIVLGYFLSRKYLKSILQKQYSVLMGFYVVGFFAFFVLMIYTYLTTFSYADSIVTGSLNRYFSDYMLLGFIPLIMPAIRGNVEDINEKKQLNVILLVMLAFFGFSTTNGFISKSTQIGYSDSSSYDERVRFNDYKDYIISLMDNDKKIYMINQDSNGTYTVVADYVFDHLIDRSGMCYYFTSKDQDIAGLNWVNIRALPEILLQDYGYLWIYQTDDYLEEQAFNVLKIKTPVNGDFYKVINENGRLKLKYLGNVLEGVE